MQPTANADFAKELLLLLLLLPLRLLLMLLLLLLLMVLLLLLASSERAVCPPHPGSAFLPGVRVELRSLPVFHVFRVSLEGSHECLCRQQCLPVAVAPLQTPPCRCTAPAAPKETGTAAASDCYTEGETGVRLWTTVSLLLGDSIHIYATKFKRAGSKTSFTRHF